MSGKINRTKKQASADNPRRWFVERLGAKGYEKWYITSKKWDGIKRQWVDRKYERTLGDVDRDYIEKLKHFIRIANNEGRSIDWAINQAIRSLKGAEHVCSVSGGDIAVVVKAIRDVLGRYGGKSVKWSRLLTMLVAGRVLEPSSKLASCSWLRGRGDVWEVLGFEKAFSVQVDDLYEAIDLLEQKWAFVLKEMTNRINKFSNFDKPVLLLYDVTSVYVEGEHIELSRYGYSRDGRSDKKQVIVGLEVDGSGYATDVRVFAGNEADVNVWRKWAVQKLENGLVGEAIVIGDGGMIPKVEQEKLLASGVKFIGRMRQSEIKKLVREGLIQRELFEQHIGEAVDDNGVRYLLISSLGRRMRKLATIDRNVKKMLRLLEEIKSKVERGVLVSKEAIDREVGAVLYRRPYRSLIWVKTAEGKIEFGVDEERRRDKEFWAGVWALRTNVSVKEHSKEEIVQMYKRLHVVEEAFRYLKTFLLKVRPIYHRLAHRISGHVKMCMLAYNVSLYLRRKFSPVLSENNKNIRQYITFREALNRLRSVQLSKYRTGEGKYIWRWTVPDDSLVRGLLNAVGLKLKSISMDASS